jgi:hypothetical protein
LKIIDISPPNFPVLSFLDIKKFGKKIKGIVLMDWLIGVNFRAIN